MRRYRLLLWFLLCLDLGLIALFGVREFKNRMPDKLWLIVGESGDYDLSLPFTFRLDSDDVLASVSQDPAVPADRITVDMNEPFSLSSERVGEYQAQLSLFGLIPVGTLDIGVMEQTTLLACGMPVGIYLHTDGVLVLGCGSFALSGGGTACPAENILRTGDYITRVNGQEVYEKEDIIAAVQEAGEAPVTLTIRRKTATTVVSVTPRRSADGSFLLGVWIRDDTAGIGTMTYVNPATLEYGALGHGITDGDTGKLFSISDGTVYPAEILSVIKGEAGDPGELVGMLQRSEEQVLGSIRKNTGFGIFGSLGSASESRFLNELLDSGEYLYPIGLRQEIELGPATILCGFDGTVKEYDIEIEKVTLGADDNKGISIRVTDPELIAKTGGIVQGMSGSPIIQNGKLVGAVTHVLIRDPLRGYGTFIEEMLAASK